MQTINYILIALILISLILVLAVVFRKNYNSEESVEEDIFSLDYLKEGIRREIQNSLKERIEELNLNRYEMEKRKNNKSKLRISVRNCICGDAGAKSYMKDYIGDLLQRKFKINEETIDHVIQFENEKRLPAADKFLILLNLYKKKHGSRAFEFLLKENHLDELKYDKEKNPYYEVGPNDIENIFQEIHLDFMDKLELLSQKIYQDDYGRGEVDELIDQKIDGVSGGVSGVPVDLYSYIEDEEESKKQVFSYDSVWCFFEGKLIYLSFLGFHTQRELKRVCNNIYRFNSPGQLSEDKGHIENDLKDGSRVVVVRPPFADGWAFLVRKHNSFKTANIEELITDPGNDIVIKAMKCLVKGCRVVAITGGQGSGKTTLLRTLIDFINPTYSIRIQELIFELNLRKMYQFRNVLTFKELPNISGQEGLDLQKKTDGMVNILGEVATAAVMSWVIQMSQVASEFTMFSHHAKTTKNLIAWSRNALLKEGGFRDERTAEEQVVNAINFDIHMGMSIDGHRCIERITQIIPIEGRDSQYELKDIIRFREGSYRIENKIDPLASHEIRKHLTEQEKKDLSFILEGQAL